MGCCRHSILSLLRFLGFSAKCGRDHPVVLCCSWKIRRWMLKARVVKCDLGLGLGLLDADGADARRSASLQQRSTSSRCAGRQRNLAGSAHNEPSIGNPCSTRGGAFDLVALPQRIGRTSTCPWGACRRNCGPGPELPSVLVALAAIAATVQTSEAALSLVTTSQHAPVVARGIGALARSGKPKV